MPVEQLWGKTSPYEALYSHSDKTAQVMEILAEFMPEKFRVIAEHLGIEPEESVRLAGYLAGVHDIGKAVPVWQGQPHAPEKHSRFYENHPELLNPDDFALCKGYRHEKGGFQILYRIWRETEVFADDRIRNNLAAIVHTHHQKKNYGHHDPMGTTRAKCGGNCPDEWIKSQKGIESFYRKRYHIDQIVIRGGDMDVPCMILSGMLIIADWMASSLGGKAYDTEADRKAFRETVRAYLKNMGIRPGRLMPDDFRDMWPWIREMRPLQKEISVIAEQEPPVLTIIEDSMGAGKTEASLFLANRIMNLTSRSGVYIALPTSATANQMHQRVDELLDRFDLHGSRLLHGTAWLSASADEDELSDAEKFLAPTRMGLFAPYGVGTIDQIVMGILKTKYGNLRISGIADKVLIIDEVHAYDAYMSEELQILLHWCKAMKVPVIMLSATLPFEKRREYISAFSDGLTKESGYPRITTIGRSGEVNEVTIDVKDQKKQYSISTAPILNDEDAIVRLALDTVRCGGTLCLNVNTVSRAVSLAKKLDSLETDIDIHLFHSQYTLARRQEIEEECIRLFGKDTSRRPKKDILVATQVVEQSLDIDFDYYITDICPVDLVLQRLGRQFRHKGTRRPCSQAKAVVLVPEKSGDYGSSKLIYMEYLLDKTKELLEETTEIIVPDDIQGMVDSVYCGDPELESERKTFLEMIMKNEVSKGVTAITALKPPQKYFQFGKLLQREELLETEASSRLAEPSTRAAILPGRLYEGALEGSLSREEQRLAFSYSFSIAASKIDFGSISQGERMLKGIYIMPGAKDDFAPTESAQYDKITVDPRYGVTVSKG